MDAKRCVGTKTCATFRYSVRSLFCHVLILERMPLRQPAY